MRIFIQKKSKKLLKLILVTLLASINVINIADAGSGDLKDIDNSFAKDDINELANKWIIKWFEDGTFKPENPASRAEFLALSLKALNKQVDELLMTTWYSDVPIAWMIKYIEKAKEYWINGQNINGKAIFRPNDNITRAEAIAMLLNISWISSPEKSKSSFNDVTSAWMIKYIEKAKEAWIINGQTIDWNLKFRPNDPITRAEAVRIIKNAIKYQVSERAQAQTFTINIANNTFIPNNITIKVWDSIRWKNSDLDAHQVSFNYWVDVKSGILDEDNQYIHTFRTPWDIDFICAIHPAMKWKIQVR
ncbi:MAG: S-layer protein [uncultured bacterium (gcode 4)]|uniref:S-layer protein n=1 Tax=uncultured bacterium (gcode 4) TaxID=1234023 RepID=K2GWU2_9BACT|nr:MAG: S-layer protein [uncultured bacterium (gcode 4)]